MGRKELSPKQTDFIPVCPHVQPRCIANFGTADMGVNIESGPDFKFWALNNPNAFTLLKEILFRWRQSSGQVPGKPGKWTVWPRDRWSEWTPLSRDQVKRELKRLVDHGMILRERHRFAGTEVRAFMQPTEKTLTHLGKPADLARIGKAIATTGAPTSAPITAPTNAPTNAPTDYTSILSIPALADHSSLPAKGGGTGKSVNMGKKGKGSTGKKKMHNAPAKTSPPLEPDQQGDDLDACIEKMLTKGFTKTFTEFPPLKGPHEEKVKHPVFLYPKEWRNFSPAVQKKLYDKYVGFVANTLGKMKSKAPFPKKADYVSVPVSPDGLADYVAKALKAHNTAMLKDAVEAVGQDYEEEEEWQPLVFDEEADAAFWAKLGDG